MEKTITAEKIHANPNEPVMTQLRKMQPDDRLEFDTRGKPRRGCPLGPG